MTSLHKRYEQQVLEDGLKDLLFAWRLWAERLADWAGEAAEVDSAERAMELWVQLEVQKLRGAKILGSIEATLEEAKSLKRVPR